MHVKCVVRILPFTQVSIRNVKKEKKKKKKNRTENMWTSLLFCEVVYHERVDLAFSRQD